KGRYERQGVLVEEEALARAERRCLADAEARRRRRMRDARRRAAEDARFTEAFAAEILRLFPGCPQERARAVAAHASARGSGRVGRSAAGRALSERAVISAVVASVRHLETPYDRLLMSGVPRHEARRRVAAAVETVLNGWARPGQQSTGGSPGGSRAVARPPPRLGRSRMPPRPSAMGGASASGFTGGDGGCAGRPARRQAAGGR